MTLNLSCIFFQITFDYFLNTYGSTNIDDGTVFELYVDGSVFPEGNSPDLTLLQVGYCGLFTLLKQSLYMPLDRDTQHIFYNGISKQEPASFYDGVTCDQKQWRLKTELK